MRCCQIPNQNNPVFPPSLVPDAQIFSNYVGGVPLANIGNPAELTVCTSALHLEMKLWEPTKFKKPYEINASFNNSWIAMLAGWNNKDKGDRFNVNEKQEIERNSTSLADIRVSGSCGLTDFDGWHLELMAGLRKDGQDPVRDPNLPNRTAHTTSLASFGRAQKLINIFLKYELCWQGAGLWENDASVVYAPPRIPSLPQYLCALHAPIDRILLEGPSKKKGQKKTNFGLLGTTLGSWLKQKQMIRSNGDLKQSSDGTFRPWSKLDCLRTYYGLQLMLRRVAMSTWPTGCACGGGANVDPAVAAIALTQECAKWFEKKYGEQHCCGENQTDWIQAAVEVDSHVVSQTLDELRSNGSARSLTAGKKTPTVLDNKANSSSTSGGGAKLKTSGQPSMNQNAGKRSVSIEEGPQGYLKLVDMCRVSRNDGMICLHSAPHLWLKLEGRSPRYLIGEIAKAGGDFTTEPDFITSLDGIPNCGMGGVGYQGARRFESIEAAIHYLKRYFRVIGCESNQKWTQKKIDGIGIV